MTTYDYSEDQGDCLYVRCYQNLSFLTNVCRFLAL